MKEKEDTHPLHAKMSHCLCCLLNTLKDPLVSAEESIKTHPTHSGHSPWDGGGMGAYGPAAEGEECSRKAPGKELPAALFP